VTPFTLPTHAARRHHPTTLQASYGTCRQALHHILSPQPPTPAGHTLCAETLDPPCGQQLMSRQRLHYCLDTPTVPPGDALDTTSAMRQAVTQQHSRCSLAHETGPAAPPTPPSHPQLDKQSVLMRPRTASCCTDSCGDWLGHECDLCRPHGQRQPTTRPRSNTICWREVRPASVEG
jgi:hypothetical protein